MLCRRKTYSSQCTDKVECTAHYNLDSLRDMNVDSPSNPYKVHQDNPKFTIQVVFMQIC